MNRFDPVAWTVGAHLTDQAREEWDSRTGAEQSQPVSALSHTAVDAVVVRETARLHAAWHDLLVEVGDAMGRDASNMRATASGFAANEAEAVAASERFWGR